MDRVLFDCRRCAHFGFGCDGIRGEDRRAIEAERHENGFQFPNDAVDCYEREDE